MSDVRETHWADADRAAYGRIGEALPEVLETVLTDWQHRVDARAEIGNAYTPHSYLRVVKAIRYETVDGVQRPAEPRDERTYLVANTQGLFTTWDTVKAHLEAHYPGTNWALHAPSNGSILVLDGRDAKF
jgi:hypothetical protein